jgi:SNF2 family DNA or RNA helicase
MASLSFVDIVFPLFQPVHWQAGVGIFHAGGVQGVQSYGELVSARVKAGIGENYEVRIKLHAQGKAVQWMECTCQIYRRRNEKCPHLAAFVIQIDQEHPQMLTKLGLGAGGSDKRMRPEIKPPDVFSQNAVLSSSAPVSGGFDVGKSTVEGLLSQRLGQIKGLSLSEEDGTLNVALQGESGKKVVYPLRADDAVRILRNDDIRALLPKKITQQPPYFAKRFFDLLKHSRAGVKVVRSVAVFEEGGQEVKTFALEDLPDAFLGREAVFLKKFGFVSFQDEMGPSQIVRWEEYPKVASLEGDTAAGLFHSGFSRLKETAAVRVAEEIAKWEVVSQLEIPDLHLKSAGEGYFFVEPSFKGLSSSEARVLDAVEGASFGASASAHRAHSSLLMQIIRARQEGKQFLQTKQGWLKLDENLDWLQTRMTSDGRLKLSSLELIKFREQMAKESSISGQGDVVARIRSGLVRQEELPLPELSHTQLKLRGYQEEGVKWLWWLHSNQLGGLLADEMGLGKTHQAMGLIAAVASKSPQKFTLVVCPTSVIDHWTDKLKTFVPQLKTVCYHGTQRRSDLLKPGKEHQVIVTSYGILLRDIDTLTTLPWSTVILDEAHLVKNQTTRTYRAACRLRSDMRLCLTGTPLENDLMELKNLFDFIAPQYLGSDAEFKRKYMNLGPRDTLAEVELHRLIHPFKLRRSKKEVLTELPDKVEDIRHCHLNKEQYELYTEALALRGQALVETLTSQNEPVPYVHIFSVISLLKQICDDPALVDARYESVGSGKLQLFDELLSEALESGQKIVVFSQYAKMIARLSQRLNAQGVRHVTLTGSTLNRGSVVREFQENDDVKVFLGSLLAGGTGIDLTSASVVIHFDRWWNAAKENQATDRIHRIGQNRAVQVYKLVTRGTLEERIDEIINRKRLLFDRFVEQDNELFKHLSREDLLELLAPPENYQAMDAAEREALAQVSEESFTVETL